MKIDSIFIHTSTVTPVWAEDTLHDFLLWTNQWAVVFRHGQQCVCIGCLLFKVRSYHHCLRWWKWDVVSSAIIQNYLARGLSVDQPSSVLSILADFQKKRPGALSKGLQNVDRRHLSPQLPLKKVNIHICDIYDSKTLLGCTDIILPALQANCIWYCTVYV